MQRLVVVVAFASAACGRYGFDTDGSDGFSEVQGCGDMTPYQAGSPWAMSGYCPAQLWQSPHNGPRETPRLRWRQRTNLLPESTSAMNVPPAIGADGRLFLGTSEDQDSNLAVLDSTTGAVEIDRPSLVFECNCLTAGATDAPMLTAGGLVVVPGTYGAIFAFQQTSLGLVTNWNQSGTGPRLWNNGDSTPPLADGSGSVVWGKAVLRLEDQAVLINEGVIDDPSLIPRQVALANGIRYGLFRGGDGNWTLVAQTFPDLEASAWGPISLPGQNRPSVAVTPTGLVVVSTTEGTFAYNERDASLLWSSPPYGNRGLAVGPSGTIYVSDGDTLRALDPANGAVLARYISPLQDGSVRVPTVDAQERLYLSTSAGALCLVQDGAELVEQWHLDLSDGTINSRPSIDSNGTLYYTLESSEIIALQP